MYKIYFRQAIGMLRENPFFSFIYIIGTAVAITLIMVMVITYEIQNGNYEPETERDRMLFVTSITAKNKQGRTSSSRMSAAIARQVFLPLETPEIVSLVDYRTQTLLSTTDQTKHMKGDVLPTDEAFWKLFSFRFLTGRYYTHNEMLAGIKQAVLSETTARTLFGTTDESVVGETVLIGKKPYTVCGIVKDVSPLANNTYAQTWIPYSAKQYQDGIINESTFQGLSGGSSIYILARSSGDFKAIRQEIDRRMEQFNDNLTEIKVELLGQPDSQFTRQFRVYNNIGPDMRAIVIRYALMILIILLIPAINMSGLISSRMQNRLGELGVRKSFGARKSTLVIQILSENLVLTLLGGIVGLVFSFFATFVLKDILLSSGESSLYVSELIINTSMVMQPAVFIAALLFCLILNLLSAGIPAWKVSDKPIVSSLNEN